MKIRRSKSEQRQDARQDLKAIQEALGKPLRHNEPFDYAVRAQQVQDAQHWNSLASELRFRPPSDPNIWDIHKATAERFRRAWDAAYPPDFWDDIQRLRAGDPAGLETAVRFLEADPMFFRSGYMKAWLIRCINPAMLTPSFAKRLQNVVLSLVDRRDDRDFRAYCRLAWKVDVPELREKLASRLVSHDPNIRRRARWVLEALEQRDRMKE